MAISVDEICERAKALPDSEKLAVVDALLLQLNPPDPAVDELWFREVQERRQAYLEGRLETYDYEEIRKELLDQ